MGGGEVSYRDLLRELAFDNHGVVTVRGAEQVGVPAVEVRKLAARGALERRGKGVYRMLEAPYTALDEYAEAVALVGEDSVLADEAVLAALDLAPINLRRIRVATRRRVRQKLPESVEVVQREIPGDDVSDIEGIPSMSVVAALLSTMDRLLPERVEDAVRRALARELISPADADRVLAAVARA